MNLHCGYYCLMPKLTQQARIGKPASCRLRRICARGGLRSGGRATGRAVVKGELTPQPVVLNAASACYFVKRRPSDTA
jgi:hypothetical protein